MHTLSIFPALLSYPLLAYFILRMVVAYGIGRLAYLRYRKSYKPLAILHLIATILILIGLYTQAALVAVILLVLIDGLLDKKTGIIDKKEKLIWAIVCIVAFSLLFLGPGSFAFDYPL